MAFFERIEAALCWLFAGDTHQITARIGIVTGAIVGFAGFALGYVALFDLFASIGLFPLWLGVFFPLLFDSLEITAAVFVLNGKFNDRPDKTAWRVVIGVTMAAVIANVSHAGHAYYMGKIDVGQAILAVIFTSIFPVAVAITVHLIKSQIQRSVERDSTIKTITDLQQEAQQERQKIEDIQQQKAQLKEQMSQQEAQLFDLQAAIESAKTELAELTKAIENVQNGRTEPDLQLIQAYQIDGWIAAGGTQVAVAKRLGVSTSTVRNRLELINGHLLSERSK